MNILNWCCALNLKSILNPMNFNHCGHKKAVLNQIIYFNIESNKSLISYQIGIINIESNQSSLYSESRYIFGLKLKINSESQHAF